MAFLGVFECERSDKVTKKDDLDWYFLEQEQVSQTKEVCLHFIVGMLSGIFVRRKPRFVNI